MRYDTPIYFVKKTKGVYQDNGDWSDGTEELTKVMASVYDTNTEMVKLLYGELKQGTKTIHIQNHYTKDFDLIRLDGKDYRVDARRAFRRKEAFTVSEVQ
jgi:hypothetical protein